MTTKICPMCGNRFTPTTNPQKYCCNRCAKEGYALKDAMRKNNAVKRIIKHDPYEFLKNMNEHLRANGGKYAPRDGYGVKK